MPDARPISCCLPFLIPALLPLQAQQEQSLPLPSSPGMKEVPLQEEKMAAGEAHLREGILLLVELHDTMARIQSHDTAEAAVPVIMRLSRKLLAWGQGFAGLPPLDDATQNSYERRYMPILERINDRLKIQGERLAGANYYGSQNLAAALIHLVGTVQ